MFVSWFLVSRVFTSLIGKTGKFLHLIRNLRIAVLVWLRWGATQWLLSRVLWTKEGSGGNQYGSPRLPNGKVVWRLLAKPIDHLFQSGPTVCFTVDSWMFGLVWQPVYLHRAVADFGNLDNPIPYTLTVQRTLVSRSKRLLLSETEAFWTFQV